MSRKPKQPSFGDVDEETRAATPEGPDPEVQADLADPTLGEAVEVDALPVDGRIPILWAHFVKPDTRWASQSSSAPAVADDGSTRIFLDAIGGVVGLSIESAWFPNGFVPMTNVASFVVKK